MSAAANAGVIAAIIAAEKKREEEEREENQMTQYDEKDLDGWEFKIMRSSLGRFNNSERVQKLCTEEAKNGWEMVEKFDNSRIRFKRRVENRGRDQFAEVDPYRIHDGADGKKVGMVIGIVLLVLGVTLFTLFAVSQDMVFKPYIIIAVVVFLALLVSVVAIKRSR